VLTGAGVVAAGASVVSTDPDVDVAEDALVGDRALVQYQDIVDTLSVRTSFTH
jgi:hypothetical protein